MNTGYMYMYVACYSVRLYSYQSSEFRHLDSEGNGTFPEAPRELNLYIYIYIYTVDSGYQAHFVM